MNGTIYKEDCKSKVIWAAMLEDLGLPADTDEICIKAISHMTENQRLKDAENADSS